MKGKYLRSFFFLFLTVGMIYALGPDGAQSELQQKAGNVIKRNCSVAGCHMGKYPQMGLNMEPGKFPATVVDVPSTEKPSLKIIDSQNPETSYLLMKIKGNPEIVGKQMPLSRIPLPSESIQTIEDWAKSIKGGASAGALGQTPAPSQVRSQAPQKTPEHPYTRPAFWGTRLINLPTAETTEKGHVLFRISHRFVPEVSSGYDFFYGLTGPANMLMSLGYALSDSFTMTLGGTNLFQEFELGADWLFLEQKKNGLPFSAAAHVSESLVTRRQAGLGLFDSRNLKFNAQISLSHQFNGRLSFLLVPAYSSNTDHWDNPSKGTLALGIGGRFMLLNEISLIAEWIPVLSGYKADHQGIGIGLEKKIGGHVFQVFILSSSGVTSDQFLPGGDLNFFKGGIRFGFNIFRTF
jgi:hypothetical protein